MAASRRLESSGRRALPATFSTRRSTSRDAVFPAQNDSPMLLGRLGGTPCFPSQPCTAPPLLQVLAAAAAAVVKEAPGGSQQQHAQPPAHQAQLPLHKEIAAVRLGDPGRVSVAVLCGQCPPVEGWHVVGLLHYRCRFHIRLPGSLQDLKLEPCKLEDFEVSAAPGCRQQRQVPAPMTELSPPSASASCPPNTPATAGRRLGAC